MEAEQFKILVTNVYPQMLARALSLLGDEGEAKEIVQQVCVNLWEHPTGIDRADNKPAYCMRAVYNMAVSRLRTTQRYESLQTVNDEPIFEKASTDETEYLLSLISTLPAAQRQAFLLRQSQEWDYTEIAQKMKIRAENVRQLISRARKKLRELYGQER